MKPVLFSMALIAALGASLPAIAETIRCESDNGRERYCRADTSRGVRLATQLSGTGCYQGDTWGYDRRGIWVSGGCRAIFETRAYSGYNHYQGNDYYYGDRNDRRNDGKGAAIAIGAIVAAAAVAAAASNNKNRSSSNSGAGSWSSYSDRGCAAGRNDRRAGRSQGYWRHSNEYSDQWEQAYASGYDRCWQDAR
jgi:hypothetical protein